MLTRLNNKLDDVKSSVTNMEGGGHCFIRYDTET